jgi:hypothetical protein
VPSTEAIARVRDQALEVARGWSGDGAPGTWRLTAALSEAVAHDEHLAALAAGIPPDRLPALLFVASVQSSWPAIRTTRWPRTTRRREWRAGLSTTSWSGVSAPSAPTTATSWLRPGAATANR